MPGSGAKTGITGVSENNLLKAVKNDPYLAEITGDWMIGPTASDRLKIVITGKNRKQ